MSERNLGTFSIRFAARADVPLILGFIRKLAEFEKLSHEVSATEEKLEETLFGPRPSAEVLIGEKEGVGAVGFALFFSTYSTFLAKPGLYLEDLFVLPEFRSHGYGEQFLIRLAQIARERNYGRLEWAVIDWNTKAMEFYKRLGAEAKKEWVLHRVSGDKISALAERFKK